MLVVSVPSGPTPAGRMLWLSMVTLCEQQIKTDIRGEKSVEEMDITLRGLIKAGDEVGVYNYLFNQRRITAKDYEGILQQSYEMQTNLPPVVNLTVSSRPLIIVGDIHGSRAHFDKFYNKYKLTDDTVLFLGDLVDRGNYSIEILSFVLALQLMRPEKYYLLRGNHEDIRVNNRYGFTNDILSLGDSSLA